MNLIEDNLREVYHAIQSSQTPFFPVVTNLTCTRIYDSRYGWGRLWRWFYSIMDCIFDSSWHQKAIHRTIQHTHALFTSFLSQIEVEMDLYENYLKKSGKGYPVYGDSCFLAREWITKWNAATKSFLKLIQHMDKENPLIQPFKITLETKLPVIKLSHAFQKIIDLEGYCGGPLPLFSIKKSLKGVPLHNTDQKEISRWITKINKEKVSVNLLHKAIKSLATFFSSKNAFQTDREAAILFEDYLENKGCKTFQQYDTKHLHWRQTIQEGTVIVINGKNMTIEAEIFPNSSGSDGTRAYQVLEHPEQIALVAHNRTVLPLRDLHVRKKNTFDIPYSHLTEISSNGKIALMQRLENIHDFKWSSEGSILNVEDVPLITAISTFIKKLIAQKITPFPLSSCSLMLDAQHQLKFAKPVVVHPFDFNAVEDFIKECSNGNSTIFQTLMSQTNLISHRTAKFYKCVLINTLKNEKIDFPDLAALYKISDPKVVDRAAVLAKQIKSLKKQHLLKLRSQHPQSLPDELDDGANQQIIAEYIQQKCCGEFVACRALARK